MFVNIANDSIFSLDFVNFAASGAAIVANFSFQQNSQKIQVDRDRFLGSLVFGHFCANSNVGRVFRHGFGNALTEREMHSSLIKYEAFPKFQQETTNIFKSVIFFPDKNVGHQQQSDLPVIKS